MSSSIERILFFIALKEGRSCNSPFSSIKENTRFFRWSIAGVFFTKETIEFSFRSSFSKKGLSHSCKEKTDKAKSPTE